MITALNVTKRFGDTTALHHLNCAIPEGCVYGLVGSNGSGKSTLLRLISGIYRPEEGRITIDDREVFDDPDVKKRIVFVPDELYFLPHANLCRMEQLYASVYERFSHERFSMFLKEFSLDPNKALHTFSKGMRRQAATILALSCGADYILFDETFDGLDPIMRNRVKNLLYDEVMAHRATAVITSHSLRELEDTCDQLALLHAGGIVFESDVDHLKTSLFKVQIAFTDDYGKERFAGVDLLSYEKHGSVATMIVRGERDETEAKLKALGPVLFEVLPLSLEEVFVYEMGQRGYAFADVLGEEVK